MDIDDDTNDDDDDDDLTDMICLLQDSLDDPSVFVFFSVLVLLLLFLSFKVSFLTFSLFFSVRSFLPFSFLLSLV